MTENISGMLDTFVKKHRLHWRVNKEIRKLGKWKGAMRSNITSTSSQDKAFLFCTSYINDVKRYKRWVNYFYPRRSQFGAESVFLINDGNNDINFDERLIAVHTDDILPVILPSDLVMFTFEKHLGRSRMFCYPGWWRSFTYSVIIAQKYGFNKIIHIESDAYVFSNRLANYIRRINSGWTALWSDHYLMPETAIQVICKDAFDYLYYYHNMGHDFFTSSERAAEFLLPFSKINNRFKGDRYGPLRKKTNIQSETFDYLTQLPTDIEIQSEI